MATTCTCKCRHHWRFLQLTMDHPWVPPENPVNTMLEVETIYEKGCEENPRTWNGIFSCIVENMTFDAALKEARRLKNCRCCFRHQDKSTYGRPPKILALSEQFLSCNLSGGGNDDVPEKTDNTYTNHNNTKTH